MKSSTFETAQSINFKLYTFFGYWKIDSKNRQIQFLYRLYSAFVVFMVTLYTVLQITDLKDSWDDVEKLSSNLSATSTSIFSLSKVYILKYKLKRIEELRRNFREYLNVPGVGTSEDREIFERDAKSYMRTCKTLYALVCPTLLFWLTLPAISNSLPVRLWVPFETESYSKAFVGLYIYECVLLCYFGAIVVSMDLILCSFVFLICAHIDVLEKNIRKFGTALSEEKTVKERQRQIGTWVQHHQQILNVVREVDSIFRSTNLVHFLGVALLISVAEYDAIQKTSAMNLQFVRQIGNLSSAFFDLFIYCHYGSLLQEKSLGISSTIYSFPWLDLDPSSRKMLVLIMLRAQRKATITAGKLFEVSLETYLTMLRSSYNLLAVLRQTK